MGVRKFDIPMKSKLVIVMVFLGVLGVGQISLWLGLSDPNVVQTNGAHQLWSVCYGGCGEMRSSYFAVFRQATLHAFEFFFYFWGWAIRKQGASHITCVWNFFLLMGLGHKEARERNCLQAQGYRLNPPPSKGKSGILSTTGPIAMLTREILLGFLFFGWLAMA